MGQKNEQLIEIFTDFLSANLHHRLARFAMLAGVEWEKGDSTPTTRTNRYLTFNYINNLVSMSFCKIPYFG